MSTLEIVPAAFPHSLQTRESFPAAAATETDSVLGKVQVADELGFAYLDGDIDFGATGKNEIYQNIKYIILTEYFSTPLDREFGFDYSMIDRPMAVAEAILTQEVALKISLYEPRAQFREISFVRNELAGKLNPRIVIVLLSSDELPRTLPLGTIPAAVAGPPGVVIEEVDLPGFFESLIEMARVPGPPGPVGAKGTAATIEVGETTTGEAGTEAEVVNVGDSTAAVFDFTIPKGDKGDQGTGITIKGSVPSSGDLPTTGNQPGDMWITADTGHGWTWDGDSWVDAGPIQGPVGPTGPQGPQGNVGATGSTGPSNVLSVSGTTTGAPGTNASVVIAGTSPAQSLAFTIPRGDVGATGTAGTPGASGPAGSAATIAVGTTTTGAPGSSANVGNSGSSAAAVFDFTIPRGDVGAQGPQGAQGVQGPAGIFRGYLFGLTLSNNAGDAVNDIDIAVGECRDYANVADMVLSVVLTKRLDANWSAGNNQGGLDTGAIANTTYHVFLIKSGAGVVDALFSASPTAPTMPGGYTYFRRIGSILRQAGAIPAFKQTGDYFQWVSPPLDVSGTANQSTTSVNHALSVPTGFRFLCRVNAAIVHGTFSSVLLRDPDTIDAVPGYVTAPLTSLHMAASAAPAAGQFDLLTNLLGQIAARASATATTLRIATIGWFDTRDKPSGGGIVEVIGTGTTGLPRSYLTGFTLSNSAGDLVNDIDIAKGVCRDSGNTADITFTSAFTKRLDAAWAVGTNQGGLDTGAIADGTYHVFAIGRSDTGTVDALFSLSATGPTLPVGYTYFRRIGAIVRKAATIRPFIQDGDRFVWGDALGDEIGGGAVGTTTQIITLSVPIGIQVFADLQTSWLKTGSAGTFCLVSSLDKPDFMPTSGNFSMIYGHTATATGGYIATFQPTRTSLLGQVRIRADATMNNCFMCVHGWTDRRGRDD